MVAKKKKKAARSKGKKKSSPKKAKQKSFVRTYGAQELVALLLKKHDGDVAVPECKVGPTQLTGGHTRRFDLWAMKKSYVHPNFIGYEIKVNRGDFLRDEKWREYLDFCSEFSFVCPPNIIGVNEVPEEAGLMVCSTNATVLYTKKKAPHRIIEPPVSLLLYVLMSRIKVTREWYHDDNIAKWKAWLAQRDEKKELGYNVSKKIRELVEKRITKAGEEAREAKEKVEVFAKVEAWLKANDIDADRWYFSTDTLDTLLEEHERGFSSDALGTIVDAKRSLQKIVEILKGDDPDPRQGRRGRRKRVLQRTRGEEVEGEVTFGGRVRVPTVQVEKAKK